jgi:hypothetical protein
VEFTHKGASRTTLSCALWSLSSGRRRFDRREKRSWPTSSAICAFYSIAILPQRSAVHRWLLLLIRLEHSAVGNDVGPIYTLRVG